MIESGSVSSCEPSPKLLDTYQKNFDDASGAGELQLKEDLADAMLESPGIRDNGKCSLYILVTGIAIRSNELLCDTCQEISAAFLLTWICRLLFTLHVLLKIRRNKMHTRSY